LGAGAIGASIALMGTSAWLISRAAQHPSEASLTLAIVGVQFFGLSRGFLRYAERLVGHDAALRVLADLRVHVYERLEAVAPAGLPLFRRGDLLARVVDDVDSLQDVVLRVIQPFAVAALVGVATVGVLWWFLPAAGLVLLLALGISATAVPWLTSRMARREESRQAVARGELAANVVDLVEGAPELVVMSATDGQVARIGQADGHLRSIARRGAGTTGIGLGLTTALAGLASWGALALGVRATHAGTLNGALLAVLALVPLAAFELVSPLPAATQAFQRARVAAGRVFDVMDTPAAVSEPRHPAEISRGPHTVTLHAAWASYPGGRRAVLRDVDLELSPRRRVALVGPSGGGKSTLADVLVRFLPADAGEATLDGTPMERLAGDDLRGVVGLVEQHPHLFDTTLAENLWIARRSATDDELRTVLTRVGLGAWLAGLPDGLATAVGPAGARLSGGQRQRVAIARALLADFPVLVLDEPTAHLEPAAADALTADLLQLTDGRSTLFITHRLAGLEGVDEVVVLAEGRVVERGTHADLLAAGGRYAGLWWEERMHDQPQDRQPQDRRPEDRRPDFDGPSPSYTEGSETP
jgi:thiol reductant ABC exporter CydC subunit